MRNILISGGTRGVGLAIARKLAADGYRVFALGRKESPDLAASIAQFPSSVLNFVPFDLADIDGIPELIREMKLDAKLRAIPVMAVTAYAGRDDEERIRAVGANAYVSKPISLARFMEEVRALVPGE